MGQRAGGGSRGASGASKGSTRGFSSEQKAVVQQLVKDGWSQANATKFTKEQWGALQQHDSMYGATKSVKAKADFISWAGVQKSTTGKSPTFGQSK